MLKQIGNFLFIFFVAIGTASAGKWASIYSDLPVQCNHWGLVNDNLYTIWTNSCTPLEVKTANGILSIPTTQSICADNQLAMFSYTAGDKKIKLEKCMDIV